jgi:glycosyltransferase involved in cell wall biosynthesis
MKATIVIPTYNRKARLIALLRCLSNQIGNHISQVIVCDDGSSYAIKEALQEFYDRLPLVYCRQEDRGFRAGQARNMGIVRAKGDIIIFVDDDVLVAEDFISEHMHAHIHSKKPLILIGYCYRTYIDLCQQPTIEEILMGEPDHRLAELKKYGVNINEHETPWALVYSGNFSVKCGSKELWFDENFVGWGMEDVEMGYRLFKDGYSVLLAPKAVALHVEAKKPLDPFRCEIRNIKPNFSSYVRNTVYLLQKHKHDSALQEFCLNELCYFEQDKKPKCWIRSNYEKDPDSVIEYCLSKFMERI